MERVRVALAAIKADPGRAVELLERGFREAPEVFIPGVAYFVVAALGGVVIDPEKLP